MNRLFLSLLAALILTLAGAGTASAANAPMGLVIDGGGWFSVTDEDVWSKESKTWSLGGITVGVLGSGNSTFNYKYSRCYGGEVRAELIITGYRWKTSTEATVTAHIDLYEGASCATTDFDGQSELYTFNIKMGQTIGVYLNAINDHEDAADGGHTLFRLRAVPA
ncbi:hypothetical protein DVA67_021315 [Solirubrobacter sp. CPCC 204708]|uniref:Uncharacterized protein n=1 Tax=Solirubrobacter deserti TaxID=2282478 RepID=A0ABT4REM3_9ACTN|nr:hypothetical protein [Solirubrobacter deserti]MBE2318534.1 hypothetical protein [Solirubrobacter deserti]MDA0136992.1 hypothetical protein [Solirubrobacter deserti]